MSPSPSSRAVSSVSALRVAIEISRAKPFCRITRASEEPIRPMPISAILS